MCTEIILFQRESSHHSDTRSDRKKTVQMECPKLKGTPPSFPHKVIVGISYYFSWGVRTGTWRTKMTPGPGVWLAPPPHEGLCPQLPVGRDLPSSERDSRNGRKLHPTRPLTWYLMNLLSTQIHVTFPRLTCAVLFIKWQTPFF